MFGARGGQNKWRGLLQGADKAGKEGLPIGAAEERIGSVLWMRHQAEDGAVSLKMPAIARTEPLKFSASTTWPSDLQ